MGIYKVSKKVRKDINDGLYDGEEEFVTSQLIEKLNRNRHMKLYKLTKKDEAKHGADWAWIIITNNGVYRFLVQAKMVNKTLTRTKASQRSGKLKKNRQVDLLINAASDTLAPIYVLFTSKIERVNCEDVGNSNTTEGIFFDSAYNIRRYADFGNKNALNHMPISCLFSTFSHKCHYGYDSSTKAYCATCEDCFYLNSCIPKEKPCFDPETCISIEKACFNLDTCIRKEKSCFDPETCIIKEKSCFDFKTCIRIEKPCKCPFEKILMSRFGIELFDATPLDDHLRLIMFAPSVIRSKYKFIEHCLYDEVKSDTTDDAIITDKIIITDYAKRHSKDYSRLLMGSDFAVNDNSILSMEFIERTVVSHAKKAGVFEKIGIFGSYARGEAAAKSDVDIALVYDNKKIKKTEQLDKITEFIKAVLNDLKKNVDFVDYNESKKTSKKFIEKINENMKWIYHYGD